MNHPPSPNPVPFKRFSRYAWGVLAYSIAVILWGAYVRGTGSGAGCGAHWPLCNGEVIPLSPRLETMIEFMHRLSSGLTLVLVAGLLIWAFRAIPRGHPVRTGAVLSAVFVVTEALVGAGLVLFELVAGNASMARAFSVSIHLANTFLLLASLALTAWWASGGRRLQLRNQGKVGWGMGVAALSVLLLGVSGAVTALGDTLFPAASLAQGVAQDLSPAANFMIRLRIFHPLMAIAAGALVTVLAIAIASTRPLEATRRFATILVGLFGMQLLAGVVNLLLLAPLWMQQIHLLLADLVWITLVLLGAATLQQPETSGEGASQKTGKPRAIHAIL
jgi:heme A synthase